jgi:hypothetical protein
MTKNRSQNQKRSGCCGAAPLLGHMVECQNTISWNTDDGSVHIYPGENLKYALIEKKYIPILIEYLQKHLRGEPVFQV